MFNAEKGCWCSIHDVPVDQRGTFYVWLKSTKHNHKLTRKIVVSEGKCDELGLALGFLYEEYVRWYEGWSGSIMFPSMPHSERGQLTLKMCDNIIETDNSILPSDEVYKIHNELINFMVYPFLHDTVQLYEGSLVYTLYDLKLALDKIFINLRRNPPMVHLYQRKLQVYTAIKHAIVEARYGYTTIQI